MKDELEQVGIFPNEKGELHNSIGTRIYSIEAKGKTQAALGGGMGAKTGLYAVPVKVNRRINGR